MSISKAPTLRLAAAADRAIVFVNDVIQHYYAHIFSSIVETALKVVNCLHVMPRAA